MGLFGGNKAEKPKTKSATGSDSWWDRIRKKDPSSLPIGTEVSPWRMIRERYVEIAIRALYSRIIFSTLDIVDIPKEISRSDFSRTVYDSHTPKLKCGLAHYIVDAMADSSSLILRKKAMQGRKKAYFFSELPNKGEEKDADLLEIDFTDYERTELLEEYYGMVFDSIIGMARLIKVGGAILFKVSDLSDLIADREVLLAVETQLKQVNQALEEGRAGYIDSESEVEMPTVDTKPAVSQLHFAFSLICNATGRPMSFVNGEIAASLGSTGEGDRKQNRNASIYEFNSILRGVFESVFGADFDVKPDIENLPQLSDFMTSIEMSSLINDDEKRRILSQYMSLDDYGISLSNSTKSS